jgi:hypothetical protein
MDNLIKWISTVAPFLAPYPVWVKGVFSGWLLLSAVLLIGLILARRPPHALNAGSANAASASVLVTQTSGDDAWLLIDGLEFYAAKPGAQVQVKANVNGTQFTYPSVAGVTWLEVGPGMAGQTFHLPPTKSRYVLRFEATVRIPATRSQPEIIGHLRSVKEDFVDVTRDLPFNGRYVLHTFDPVAHSRSASAEASLVYRVMTSPR